MGGGQANNQPVASATPTAYGTPEPNFGSAIIGASGLPPDDPDYQRAIKGKDLQDIWNKANSLLEKHHDNLDKELEKIGVDYRMFPMRGAASPSIVQPLQDVLNRIFIT